MIAPLISRLDRYIAAALFKGWALVLVVLLAVFSLLAFVDELDHIGGRYRAVDALRFIALTMPQRALDLAPVITLLGTLIALAALAKSSELIAIRAAGVPISRFLRSIALPSVVLVVGLGLSAEYLTAPLYQKAEAQRSVIRSGKGNLLKGKGLWSNSGLSYFNVRKLHLGRIPMGIDLYDFSPDGRLKTAIHAEYAEVKKGRKWNLVNVEYKQLVDGRLISKHMKSLDMGPFWSRDELPVLSLSTAGMSLSGLYEYGRYLEDTGQRSRRIELAFWQKATIPLAAGAMVLLATPIGAGLGSRRSPGFGRRIAIGAFIGIVFYLGTQIIHTAGLLLGLNSALIALLPVLLILAAGGVLLYRMR